MTNRSVRLYHTTSESAAALILAEGFRGSEIDGLVGVWFADAPTDDGVSGSGAVLTIELPEAILLTYELPVVMESWSDGVWTPDDSIPTYRAFCLPAELINRHAPAISVMREPQR